MSVYQKLLEQDSFHFCLLQMDRDLLDEARKSGCPICHARLHRSDYPRHPRGVANTFHDLYAKRFSLCCAQDHCRHRVTPFSARFLGRMQHISAMVVICSAMLHGLTPPRQRQLQERLGVSRAVVRHWQTWWRCLPQTSFWKTVRGRLLPSFNESQLPSSLLAAFGGDAGKRLQSLLRILLPLTSRSAPTTPSEGRAGHSPRPQSSQAPWVALKELSLP